MYLDTCTFAYNTSRQESTLYTPFEVMFGRKPVIPVELDTENSSAAELLKEDSTGIPTIPENLTSYRQDLLTKVYRDCYVMPNNLLCMS